MCAGWESVNVYASDCWYSEAASMYMRVGECVCDCEQLFANPPPMDCREVIFPDRRKARQREEVF